MRPGDEKDATVTVGLVLAMASAATSGYYFGGPCISNKNSNGEANENAADATY